LLIALQSEICQNPLFITAILVHVITLAVITASIGKFAHACSSIFDPSLYLDYSWKTHPDLCGSDHFSTEITCDITSRCETNSSWKVSTADWNTF